MKKSRMNQFTAVAMLTVGIACGSQTAGAASYADYIAGTNPVGWWGMNESGATATTADLSGAYGAANNQAGVNLPMTYQGLGVNTIADQAGYVSGVANRAAYFDGTSNSGAYAHGAVPYDLNVTGPIYRYEPGGFSGEFWMKPELIGGGLDAQRVLASREYGFGFEDASIAHRLQFTTFGKQDYFSTASIPIDGNWHQVGFSFDGNLTTSFFIDGADAGTSVGGSAGIRTALSPGANTMNLGHRNTDLQHFKGTLDEAVLWGAPRSAADFAASYAAAVVPEPGTLVLLGVGLLGFARRRR